MRETTPSADRSLRAVLLALAVALAGSTGAPAEDAPSAPSGASFDLAAARVVDLSHPYDARTLFWPSEVGLEFALERIHSGPTAGGWFYAANRFCMPEHGGTHLDAPLHFGEGRRAVDAVPLDQLVAPGIVIDVGERAAANVDYLLSLADVVAWERAHGAVPQGAIVLLRTGWESRWSDRKAYFGDDTPGDASHLHFPSFGPEAVAWLIERRGIGALGVDTASIDAGASTEFLVHRVAAAHEVPALENLTNLTALPATGFWIVALPMKIGGGSGAPLRAVALLQR